MKMEYCCKWCRGLSLSGFQISTFSRTLIVWHPTYFSFWGMVQKKSYNILTFVTCKITHSVFITISCLSIKVQGVLFLFTSCRTQHYLILYSMLSDQSYTEHSQIILFVPSPIVGLWMWHYFHIFSAYNREQYLMISSELGTNLVMHDFRLIV